MEINKLYSGLVVKNYKELCLLLGIEEKKAASKNAQLKEMERYFSFTRDGHKIIIDKIYSTPLPKIDGRMTQNTSSITKYFIDILMNSSYKNSTRVRYKKDMIYFPKTVIWEMFGMVNSKYNNSNHDFIKDEITQKDISLFYHIAGSRLTQLTERALKNMKNRGLISDYGLQIIIQKGSYYYVADDNEKEIIKKEKKRIMRYLKCLNYNDVIASNQMDKYNNMIRDLFKLKYNWLVQSKHFYFSKPVCNNKKDVNQIRLMLNGEIVDCIYKEFEAVYNRYIKKQNELKADNKKIYEMLLLLGDNSADMYYNVLGEEEQQQHYNMMIEYPENFLDNMKYLIDELIKISSK